MAIKIQGNSVINDDRTWNYDFEPASSSIDIGANDNPWRYYYGQGGMRSDNSFEFLNATNGGAQGIKTESVYAGITYADQSPGSGVVDVLNGFKVQGTTIVDSNRNVENIISITTSGDSKANAFVIGNTTVINSARNLENLGTGSGGLSMTGSRLDMYIGGSLQGTQELDDSHTHTDLNTSIDGKSDKYGSYPKNDGSGSMHMAIGALPRRSGWYDGGLPACNSDRAGLMMIYQEGFTDPIYLVLCTPNAWYVLGGVHSMCNSGGDCGATSNYYGMTIKGD